MSNINALAVASIPVYNAQVPSEGPVGLTVFLDFTATVEYFLDGKPLVDQGYVSLLQTVYLDTTDCVSELIMTIEGSRQKIRAKPNTQGYYPIVCPNPFKITFHCDQGPAGVYAILLNMPVAPSQWSVV